MQAGATQVWANEGNHEAGHVLHSNLASAFVDAQGGACLVPGTVAVHWHGLSEMCAAAALKQWLHVVHGGLLPAGHSLPEGWRHLGEDAAVWTGTPVDSQATCMKSLRPANE